MASITKHYIRGRHPKGFWGRQVLKSMNGKQHAAMPEWVLAEMNFKEDARLLDLGCGGGANIARLLKLCPKGIITGLDYSQLALETTNKLNYHAIVDKQCHLIGGNAVQMPLAKDIFDVVTAFETIYYWLSLELGFSDIYRVLKPGGTVVIANELDGLLESDRQLEKASNNMLRVYTIQEISFFLKEVGFTDIKTRHDEQRRFICITARKPQ